MIEICVNHLLSDVQLQLSVLGTTDVLVAANSGCVQDCGSTAGEKTLQGMVGHEPHL